MTLHLNEDPPAEIEALMRDLGMSGLTPAEIPRFWDLLVPLMDRAVGFWEGRNDSEHLLRSAILGDCQVWTILDPPMPSDVVEAVIVTEIVDYPLARACRYVLVAGTNLDQWQESDKVISAWAKTRGCTLIEGAGRAGWKARAKKMGYTVTSIIFEREL